MFPLIFCTFVGAGAQIVACFYFGLIASFSSLISPLNQSTQYKAIMISFPCFSALNGYVSARLYKFFSGTYWLPLTFLTSMSLTGFVYACLTVMNICEFIETGKNIVSDIYIMLMIWVTLNIPLCLVGTYAGFKQQKLQVVTKVNKVPREAKQEPTCLLNPLLCMLFCSSVPFSLIYYHFYRIFDSVSGSQHITILHALVHITFLLLALIICEVAII